MLVAQLYPTLCDPVDCSPLGSSVHGILQARMLECITIPFSRGSSQPEDWTLVSCIAARFFMSEPPGKPMSFVNQMLLTGDISIFTYINKLPVTGFSFCKTLVVNNVLFGNCKWVKYKVMNYSLTNRIIFSFKKCFLSTCNPYGQKSLACCSPCSYVDLDTV